MQGLEVHPGDGTFSVSMTFQLVAKLAELMKGDASAVTIEPAYIDRGGEALYLTLHHEDQRDGAWTTTHLMTQKGIVEL